MMVWISVESVVISPLSFFIASIWLFSLFFFISLASGLSILLIFSKKPALEFIYFLKGFSCLYLLQFCSDLTYFLPDTQGRTVISTLWEAEAGELLQPKRQWLHWAEMVPLHSSLDNKARLYVQKKKKTEEGTWFIIKWHRMVVINLGSLCEPAE